MIEFVVKNDLVLESKDRFKRWIIAIIKSENKTCGDISYTFCDDAFLDKLNQKYLNHEDYTDIISFDSTVNSIISGDIFISTERIGENAKKYGVDFKRELLRVMAHGLLHFCGFDDKTGKETQIMRKKEDEKIGLFHVEQL